jgi:hypothetical protein
MVTLGDAFFWNEDRSHLWVVISTPQGRRAEFVMVNVTSLDEKIFDESCILQPADYPQFIDHPTAVFYVDAKVWWIAGANGYDAIAFGGNIARMPALRPATLLRIQQGALRSDFFPPDYKPLVQDSLVVLPAPPPRPRAAAPRPPPPRRP